MKHTRFIYLSLFVVALILYIFMPSKVSAVFFYGLAISAMLSFLFLLISFFGLSVKEELLTPKIKRGSQAHFKITFKNLPFSFSYLNPIFTLEGASNRDNAIIISSPFIKSVSVEYKVTYNHCGNYTVGFDKVKITDLFGLFSFKKRISHTDYISVMPLVFELSEFPIESFGESSKTTPKKVKTFDLAELAGIKDYSGSESIKQIHWNMSAKHQKLLVKEYEEELKRQITVSLLPGKVSVQTDVLDKMLETAVSVIDYAKNRGSSVQLQIGSEIDRAIEMLSDDFTNSLLLANIETLCKDFSVEELISRDDGIQAFISAEISDTHLDTLLRSSTKGDGKVFILVASKFSNKDRALIEKFRNSHIKIFAVKASSGALDIRG